MRMTRAARLGMVLLVLATGCQRSPGPASHPSASASGADAQTVGILTIPASGEGISRAGARKAIILRGTVLTGTVPVSYRDGKSYLGNIQWEPPPRDGAEEQLRTHRDSTRLSPAALKMFDGVPTVARLRRDGVSEGEAIARYMALQESLLTRVRRAYRAAGGGGTAQAERAARAQIDTTMASNDLTGPRAPRFSDGGGTLYLYGFGPIGWISDRSRGGAAKPDPERYLKRARADLQFLDTAMKSPAPVLALYTKSASFIYIGTDATRAFGELDMLQAAPTSTARHAMLPNLKALPSGIVSELEESHFFKR